MSKSLMNPCSEDVSKNLESNKLLKRSEVINKIKEDVKNKVGALDYFDTFSNIALRLFDSFQYQSANRLLLMEIVNSLGKAI